MMKTWSLSSVGVAHRRWRHQSIKRPRFPFTIGIAVESQYSAVLGMISWKSSARGHSKPEWSHQSIWRLQFLMQVNWHFCHIVDSFQVTAVFSCRHNDGMAIWGVRERHWPNMTSSVDRAYTRFAKRVSYTTGNRGDVDVTTVNSCDLFQLRNSELDVRENERRGPLAVMWQVWNHVESSSRVGCPIITPQCFLTSLWPLLCGIPMTK
jgi:hypothetical protein